MSEATVLTSENSAEFYANKLGLAAESEPVVVEETPTEPVEEISVQNESDAEDEEKSNRRTKTKAKTRKEN